MKEMAMLWTLLVAGYVIVDSGSRLTADVLRQESGMPELSDDQRHQVFDPEMPITAADARRYREINGIQLPANGQLGHHRVSHYEINRSSETFLVVASARGTPLLYDRGVRFPGQPGRP
ncbi:MAG: hypothetical protein DWH91_18640 [Planctomycetota bacterium]|nr:MAG: hypothetical protein DWH91_18640 [Planctomycetota bacterium]